MAKMWDSEDTYSKRITKRNRWENEEELNLVTRNIMLALYEMVYTKEMKYS